MSGIQHDNPGDQSGQDASSDKPVQGPQPASSVILQRDGEEMSDNGENDEGNC